MTEQYDGRVRADARFLPIADETVQCVVTSPPYWGLRDYGLAGQIGQEETPNEFVASIVDVFREVKRVLRPDGCLWLNMGDSYARNGGTQGGVNREMLHLEGKQQRMTAIPRGSGLKPKDLVGMPWMIAFALRADGWYLRQEIIWHKTQAMPESVNDRPTRNHEQLFLLSKSPRYFYDIDAIKEDASPDTHARYSRGRSDDAKHADGGPQKQTIARSFEGMDVSKQDLSPDRRARGFNDRWKTRIPGVTPKSAERSSGVKANSDFHQNCSKIIVERVNKRTVWSLGTANYSGSHWAVFPPLLVEPCILAGSRRGDFVLDPFAGSGTVAMVAEQHRRRWISVDLGYQDLQAKRLSGVQWWL